MFPTNRGSGGNSSDGRTSANTGNSFSQQQQQQQQQQQAPQQPQPQQHFLQRNEEHFYQQQNSFHQHRRRNPQLQRTGAGEKREGGARYEYDLLPNGEDPEVDKRTTKRQRFESYHFSSQQPDYESCMRRNNDDGPQGQQTNKEGSSYVEGENDQTTVFSSPQQTLRLGKSLQKQTSNAANQVTIELHGLSEDSITLVLKETLKVCQSIWAFKDGRLGDHYEPLEKLHDRTVHLLEKFAMFVRSNNGKYLQPVETTVQPQSIVALGTTISALEELLNVREFCASVYQRPIDVGFSDCRGFLWDNDRSTVPAYIDRVKDMGDVVVLADCMLTNAGVPTIAKASARSQITGHLCYGRGITLLVDHAVYPVFRKSGEIRKDDLVGAAVMLSPRGPQLVHIHVPLMKKAAASTPSSDSVPSTPLQGGRSTTVGTSVEEAVNWLDHLWPTEVPTVVSISGGRRHDLTELLANSSNWMLKDSSSSSSPVGGGGGAGPSFNQPLDGVTSGRDSQTFPSGIMVNDNHTDLGNLRHFDILLSANSSSHPSSSTSEFTSSSLSLEELPTEGFNYGRSSSSSVAGCGGVGGSSSLHYSVPGMGNLLSRSVTLMLRAPSDSPAPPPAFNPRTGGGMQVCDGFLNESVLDRHNNLGRGRTMQGGREAYGRPHQQLFQRNSVGGARVNNVFRDPTVRRDTNNAVTSLYQQHQQQQQRRRMDDLESSPEYYYSSSTNQTTGASYHGSERSSRNVSPLELYAGGTETGGNGGGNFPAPPPPTPARFNRDQPPQHYYHQPQSQRPTQQQTQGWYPQAARPSGSWQQQQQQVYAQQESEIGLSHRFSQHPPPGTGSSTNNGGVDDDNGYSEEDGAAGGSFQPRQGRNSGDWRGRF